jgi:LuxR family maltose regulon positive regulatory protein
MVTDHPGLRLLHTKLLIPGAHPVIVERASLNRKLTTGLTSRLVLVTAPAGYGKTTLLSKHFERPDRPTAWVSLDERDNEPIRFWSYFIAAIQSLDAAQGKTAQAMLISSQPPPIENILVSLINDVTTFEDDFTLCLDDYHLITQPEINEGMVFLIENLPNQMHLVIAGRSEPPFPLPILRTRRQMIEIEASDLRFSNDEVAQFLNQLMDLNLSPDQINKIDEATEGWAAGIQLAALSLQGAEDISQQVQTFTGEHRFIFDYLAQEVLNTQTVEVQDFLLRTAILDQLNGNLCDAALYTNPDIKALKSGYSQSILEHLERSNLFIIPLDQQRHWYRYHHLFSDFLKNQLDVEVNAEEIMNLHSNASLWFMQNNMIFAAIDHAIKSGDYYEAAKLIEDDVNEFFSRSELPMLTAWFDEIPPEVFKSLPRLSIIAAWAYLALGQNSEVESHLHSVEEVIGSKADGSPESMTLPSEIRGALAEICCIRTSLSFNIFDLTEVMALSNRTQEYLTFDVKSGLFNEKRDILAVTHFNQGILFDLTGEITKASTAFSKTIALNEENLQLIPMAISHLARLQELQGLLHEAEATYRMAMRITEEHAYPLPLSGLVDVGLGNIFCERNQLELAKDQLEKGVDLGKMWGVWGILIPGYIGLARVALTRGQLDEANLLIEEAIEIIGNLEVALQTPILEARQAMLWARQGDHDAAANWSLISGIDPGQPIPFNQEPIAIPLSRVWIAMGKYDEARDLLIKLIESNEARQAWGQVLQVKIFESLAAYLQGDFEFAFDSIERALKLAEIENYQRIFLDEGQMMQEILVATNERLSGDPKCTTKQYIGHLLKAFEAEPFYSTKQIGQMSSMLEPLSDRELEVFKLLEGGLSNQEMAANLHISLNTVKAHLKSIYGKLGVNNRVQAVAKGRELHLF